MDIFVSNVAVPRFDMPGLPALPQQNRRPVATNEDHVFNPIDDHNGIIQIDQIDVFLFVQWHGSERLNNQVVRLQNPAGASTVRAADVPSMLTPTFRLLVGYPIDPFSATSPTLRPRMLINRSLFALVKDPLTAVSLMSCGE